MSDIFVQPLTAPDLFEQQATVLRALAHASRLRIIHRLGEGECAVGELVELVGLDRTTVSKHLALLRAHRIVATRRDGNTIYYRLLTPSQD